MPIIPITLLRIDLLNLPYLKKSFQIIIERSVFSRPAQQKNYLKTIFYL